MSTTSPHASAASGSAAVLTILGLTDLHGHVRSYDYGYDRPVPGRGLARAATAIEQVRTGRAAGSVLVFDVGDTIQGSALVRDVADGPNPMAVGLNAVGVQAAAIGNHDFDHGEHALHEYAAECDFPVIAVNVHRAGRPAFAPWTILHTELAGLGAVRIGVLGLTTPGTAVWDGHVVGDLRFDDIVDSARVAVPRLRAAGAELVIVLSHSGLGPSSTYDPSLAHPENDTARLVAEVPGIDAVLLGHAHETVAAHLTCAISGQRVPVAEAGSWGSHVARIDLTVARAQEGVRVLDATVALIETAGHEEHPELVRVIEPAHSRARQAMHEVVGESQRSVSMMTATVEHNPFVAMINHVQASTAASLLTGTPYAALPVVSVTAAPSRSAYLPGGTVRLGQLSACCPFDNILMAVPMTATGLAEYLEHAATYFRAVDGPGPHRVEDLVGAPRPDAPDGVPHYNYDIAGAVDGQLTYELDITAPSGNRLRDLRLSGRALTGERPLIVAMTSYRAAGGGRYPWTATNHRVLDAGPGIPGLLLDWVRQNSPVTFAHFTTPTWRLVAGDRPLQLA